MTAQHMVEHLEMSYRIASGEKQDFEIATLQQPELLGLFKSLQSLFCKLTQDQFTRNLGTLGE